MEEYRYLLNDIQYEYIYHVCERLAPFLDEFDNNIKVEKKNKIILRCLIDALFDMDVFLDFLKRNSIVDTINVPLGNNIKGFKKDKLEKSIDKEKIEKAFLSYKSLFNLNYLSDKDEHMPYSIISNFVNYNKNKELRENLSKYFEEELTCDDVKFKQFITDFIDYCNDVLFKYVFEENKRINRIGMDQILLTAVKETLHSHEYEIMSLYKREDFIRDFIYEIRNNECISNMGGYDYSEVEPKVSFNYGKETDKNFSIRDIILFNHFVNNPLIGNMSLDDFLDYLISNYNSETIAALNRLNINPEDFIKAVSEARANKNEDGYNLIEKVSVKEQLEDRLNKASLIVEPELDISSSVSIFDYGDSELKEFSKIINDISMFATENVIEDTVLVDCINGVIPKLTIFDRLNSVTMSEKIGNRIDDTKTNFNTVEDNLKIQILAYEYLIKVNELKESFINSLEARINEALLNDNPGLINMALEKRKENLEFFKSCILTSSEQIRTLASNHINVLNMLYRTKETFFTVIEGQTLINASIQQEKLALKNIRRIVDVYDSALSNDFETAFNMIGKLKRNGLDSNSLLQLETNINNIQSLHTPRVVDHEGIIKEDLEPVKILEKNKM